MTVELDYWGLACRVLLECGRARVHNLRNSLNAVALGVELLGDGQPDDRLDHIRVQIADAAVEIEALQTLILEAAQPHIQTLPDAALWAARMAQPVAKRRAVDLTVSPLIQDLPGVAVPEGFSVAVGELLLTACLASERGTECSVTRRPVRDVDLTVLWRDASDVNDEKYAFVNQLIIGVLGPNGRCTANRDGAVRRVSLTFDAKE